MNNKNPKEKQEQQKKIFCMLLEMERTLTNKSKEIYETQLAPYLQETSHSFGFKPFTDISEYILKQISKMYELNEDIIYDYLFEGKVKIYFNEDDKKEFIIKNDEELYELVNILNIGNQDFKSVKKDGYETLKSNKYLEKQKEMFTIVQNVVKKLNDVDYEIGNKYRDNLTFQHSDIADYSYKPAYEMKEIIYKKMDCEILLKENKWETLSEKEIEELFNEGSGLFYFYCEQSEFGDNEVSFYEQEEKIVIKNLSFNDVILEIEEKRKK